MSYVKVQSSKVIEACNKTIDYWRTRRKDTAEELIDEEMQSYTIAFEWPPIRKKTREEAIKFLKSTVLDHKAMLYQLSQHQTDEEEIAMDLRTIAEVGDPVTISSKHAFIFR